MSKCAVKEGITRSLFFLCLCVCETKRKSLLTGLTSTVELTNHRVYQELVYGNEVLKTMLARSNSSQLPRGFRATFIDALSRLSWNSLRQKKKSALFIPLPPPILTRRCCVGVKATFRKQQTTQLWMSGVRKGSRLFCFP